MIMPLRTMQAVVATLNDNRNSPIADQIAAAWQPASGSVRYVRASANFIFVGKREQPFVVRFAHASERNADQIAAELAFVRYLAAQGVPVAQPIRSAVDRYVETVPTSLGAFHAVAFELVDGDTWDFADLTLDQFRVWGRALGQLHAAAQNYPATDRPTWRDHLAQVADGLPAAESAARTVFDQITAQLKAMPLAEQNAGLIHFDFELDNIIWHNGQAGVIDFDDCAVYPFAADLAFALRDLFNDDPAQVKLDDPALRAFVDGYRARRALAEADVQLIPLFLRLHNLITFTRLLQVVADFEPATAPAWACELRATFETKLDAYRATFADQA